MDTTKKTGTFQGKSNALGGGGRFAQMKAKGMSGGLAAFIGRKIYGKKKMAKMAAKGKKNPEDVADKGVDDSKENPNGTLKTPPKGISIGNPKKVS